MMLSEQSQKWFPTHVQVTVIQAKDLKPKGKNGTNDTYTIIQLGKEKYSTSVAEKTLSPVWKEEASFELPGVLLQNSSEKYILILTVMHRSLVGLDKFLGQVSVNLNDLFENKQRRKMEWFKLQSKPGAKSKDRGELQVNIQFMRNNMTASMFDLSVKDKTRSPFSKLKDKMKGRKNDGTFSDTSSAIIPSTNTAISDTSGTTASLERQIKLKPKKPFLLGPQRLSAAHSMSDLTASHPSVERIKSSAAGPTQFFRPQLDSVNSIEETGNAKSPHRRSFSMDTAKMNQIDSTSNGSDSAFDRQNDPFADVSSSLPQKFATLPRNKNPFEDRNDLLESSSIGISSKQNEIKKEPKKEKKEKTSLFERVTGKKDGKKSDKLSNGRIDNYTDLKSPTQLNDSHQESYVYDSKNPFATNYRNINARSWSGPPLTKPPSSEDAMPAALAADHKRGVSEVQLSANISRNKDISMFETTAAYHNLSHEEVVQELVKHKEMLKKKDTHIRELEDYIDNLLVRVMEETPSILRVPYEPSKRAGKFAKSK
ncbi:rab11 family-interacting protein 2 [Protopterus annectens]|uniref:rab11 family-interacting protein 2 n=1 Tax=Protopterus annectens TaxID=7888 RepID=UPI001CFA6FD2|nr:rab11 family-interacting protein 2 [Protopterus annectens]